MTHPRNHARTSRAALRTHRAGAIAAMGVATASGLALLVSLLCAPPLARAGQRTDPPASPGAEEPRLTRTQRPDDPFTPSRHGFAFVNHFTGSSLPPELRDATGGFMLWARNVATTYADLPDEFGLCGGMSLSAADHYASQTPIPDSQASPEQGTALYDAIYQRQRDSLGHGASYVLKFAQWMALPDVSPAPNATDPAEGEPASGGAAGEPQSTSALTRLELPAICQALERGELVPLGLVLTRAGQGRLWQNHQVLAYRVERLDDATLHVFIYDPNYPADDRCLLRIEGLGVGVLGLDPSTDAARIATLAPGNPATTGDTVRTTRLPTEGRPRAVRGVFPMPWEPVEPTSPGPPATDEATRTNASG